MVLDEKLRLGLIHPNESLNLLTVLERISQHRMMSPQVRGHMCISIIAQATESFERYRCSILLGTILSG